MLARQWCRCGTNAGQPPAPPGCPQDRRSTVRRPHRVRADGGWRSQYKNVYAGDWNSHVGQGHDSPRCGRDGLPRQIFVHSQRTLNWLGEVGLWHIDSFVPLRHRSTWQLVRDLRWNELDYFVSDIAPNLPSSRRWQKMSTVCVPLTDHHGKVVTLQLLGRIRQRVKIEDKVMGHSGFDGTPIKPRLRTDKMRGPSDGAIAKRSEYETKTGELWAEMKRTKQTGEEGRWQRVAGLLVEAADMVVGRAPTTSEVPLLDPLRDEEKAKRDELVASWDGVRRERDDQRRHELKQAHNKKVKRYRARRRRRRTQLVHEAVSRLEANLKCSDWGAFYRGLASLAAGSLAPRRTENNTSRRSRPGTTCSTSAARRTR